jgi:protein-tyrosine phosphatase
MSHHKRAESKRMAEVVPGLWIGGIAALSELANIPLVSSWSVVSILNSCTLTAFVQKSLQQRLEKSDTRRSEDDSPCSLELETHIEWELPDQSNADFISRRLDEILQHMDMALNATADTVKNVSSSKSSSRACLVHCAFGISRSAAVCAAWLLSSRRCLTLPDALACVRNARPDASPNMGFLAGLRALEQSQGDVKLAIERMKRNRTIPKIGDSSSRDRYLPPK